MFPDDGRAQRSHRQIAEQKSSRAFVPKPRTPFLWIFQLTGPMGIAAYMVGAVSVWAQATSAVLIAIITGTVLTLVSRLALWADKRYILLKR